MDIRERTSEKAPLLAGRKEISPEIEARKLVSEHYITDADGACKTTTRHGQEGTWITEDVREAYIELHRLGHAHSFEAWEKDQLVGGLYGIRMGKIFFGESMFSNQSNASKAAFIWAVQKLQKDGVLLIDCQVYTAHLESLGARFISRTDFMKLLETGIPITIGKEL
jgi:leucyl/phenylalanyl-tRNA--protein transferase